MGVKLYPLREPFSRGNAPPRRPPPLTLRRQPCRNFPLQFFFCARPLKKIQKRKGKFLLGSALQVFGRSGGASLRLGGGGIPSPPPPYERNLYWGFCFPVECREAKRHYLPTPCRPDSSGKNP